MYYRKKPVVVRAWRLTQENYNAGIPSWVTAADRPIHFWYDKPLAGDGLSLYGAVSTLEGDMVANEGDWIIEGVAGELYPCKNDVFEKTYEDATQ